MTLSDIGDKRQVVETVTFTQKRIRETPSFEPSKVIAPPSVKAAAIEDARALYMRTAELDSIYRITGIPISELQVLIYEPGGWREQLGKIGKSEDEEESEKYLRKVTETEKGFVNLIAIGLQRLQQKYLTDEEKVPTAYELAQYGRTAERLADIRTKMDMEDPDRKAKKALSPSEIIQTLAGDPFMKQAIIANTEIPSLPETFNDAIRKNQDTDDT